MRAHRSRRVAVLVLRRQHAKATKVAQHPSSTHPHRLHLVTGWQQWLQPEQLQPENQQPLLHDEQQSGGRYAVADDWEDVLEQHCAAAAAVRRLAVAHCQPLIVAVEDHEHLAVPTSTVLPLQMRGGRSRDADRT